MDLPRAEEDSIESRRGIQTKMLAYMGITYSANELSDICERMNGALTLCDEVTREIGARPDGFIDNCVWRLVEF